LPQQLKKRKKSIKLSIWKLLRIATVAADNEEVMEADITAKVALLKRINHLP
jgi:hypothetical protein